MPPVAVNDTYIFPSAPPGSEYFVVAPGVLLNDSNVGSGQAQLVTGAANGQASLSTDGTVIYFANAGFAGIDSFTYCIAVSGSCVSNTAMVTLSLAPWAGSDFYSTLSGDLVVAAPGILANDSVAKGDTAILFSGPTSGTLSFNADGSFHYVANSGFSGADSFSYCVSASSACDSSASNIASVDIHVGEQAFGDSYGVPGLSLDVSAADGVLANDTVNPGETVFLSGDVSGGALTLNPDGSFTYTPTAGFLGEDTFTYCLTNDEGECATVFLFVEEFATDDSYTVPRSGLSVAAPGVLANDRTDGEPVGLESGPTNGTLTLNSDGSFDYAPDSTFVGTDQFTYCLIGEGCGAEATVTLNVLPGAVDDFYSSTVSGITIAAPGVLANDVTDAATSAQLVTQAANGTVSLNADGSFTYTPNAGFAGDDSFTYCDVETSGCASTATVTISVSPFAADDSYTTVGGTVSVAAPGVLGNDSLRSGDTASLVTDVSHGTLTLNPDGSFDYTATFGFVGTDSFTYCITGDLCASNDATVTITVNPIAVNDTYDVPGLSLTVAAPGVLANDSVAAGEHVTLDTNVSSGTLTLNPDGSFTYTPNPGFAGQDSFSYCLASDDTQCATVTLIVPDIAVDDSYTVPRTGLTVNAPGITANDRSAKGETLAVQGQPAHGTLTLNPDGSFTYIPDATFAGTDSFTYCYEFDGCASNTATVTLDVPPNAVDDAFHVPADGITIGAPGVLGNDITGTGMTAKLLTHTTHGIVVLNPDGSFTYTPSNAATSDSFTYCIALSNQCLSGHASVKLTIDVKPPPTTTTSTPPPPTTTTSTPPPPTTTSTPPDLTLLHRTVSVGSTNVARGAGCAAGATVTLSIEGHAVATTTADATGHFQAPFTVPELSIGQHSVSANCGHVVNAAFDVVETSEVDAGTTTVLILMLFILLGVGLLRGQSGMARSRRSHG